MLQFFDVRADDPGGLDTFQAQLAVDLFDEVVAQSGHLVAQLRKLVAQHSLHLVANHHCELLVVFATPHDRPLALRDKHVGVVGFATPGAEQREGTQEQAPQPDEQPDLNLFLSMSDDDEVNGNAAQP
jgi:hypothetical protein